MREVRYVAAAVCCCGFLSSQPRNPKAGCCIKLLLPVVHRISTLLDFAEHLVFIRDFSQADFFAAFEKILSRAQNRGLC